MSKNEEDDKEYPWYPLPGKNYEDYELSFNAKKPFF